MEDKRGTIEINLFVLLVLMVTITSLFIFLTHDNKVEEKVYDAKFIEKIYSKKDVVESVVGKIGGDVFEEEGNFKNNFQREFSKYSFDEPYLKDLKKLVAEGNFEVYNDGEFLEIEISELEIKESLERINIIYSPLIFVKFNLGD